MAENIVAGLFGLTPEMYGEQQRRSALREGIDLAKLTPGEAGAAMTYAGARGLGGAIAGALGVEDPQLNMISVRQQIMSQLDQSDPESIIKGAQMLAQAGDQQGAMALAQLARQAQSEMALTQQRRASEQSSLATAAKIQLSIRQEEELRAELSKLGPDATQDQVISVLTKYGPTEKVLAALTAAQSRTEATLARTESTKTAADAALERAKVAADAKIEAARERGATALQIAQLQTDTKRELAQLAISLKESASAELLTPKEKQKREAAFPQATSAIKGFETKADSFVNDIKKLRDEVRKLGGNV